MKVRDWWLKVRDCRLKEDGCWVGGLWLLNEDGRLCGRVSGSEERE